jgi:hypothetical protein
MIVFFAFGCKEKGFVPGYIYIDQIFLETDPNGLQGSNSNGITNVTITSKGTEIGQFEPPCAVPLEITDDEMELTFTASVKTNGVSNPREIYPFYSSTKEKVSLTFGKIDTVRPTFRYRDNTLFPWIEGFENGISLSRSGRGDTAILLSRTNDPDEVKDYDGDRNQYSVKAVMPFGFRIFEYSSNAEFELPVSGSNRVFLEFDYKSDVILEVGFYANDGIQQSIVSLVEFFPTSTWNKAYVSLSEDLAALPNPNNSKIKIRFNAIKDSGSPESTILLDNIKLVHQ